MEIVMLGTAHRRDVNFSGMDQAHATMEIPSARNRTPDVVEVIRLLNVCLVNEICCVLNYSRRQFIANQHQEKDRAREFLQHVKEEQAHADLLAARIVALGGELDFQARILEAQRGTSLSFRKSERETIHDTLNAERSAIEGYRELLQYLGNSDATTRQLVEGILITEEQHAHALAELLPGQNVGDRQVPAHPA